MRRRVGTGKCAVRGRLREREKREGKGMIHALGLRLRWMVGGIVRARKGGGR
jgi:hypothetical protein